MSTTKRTTLIRAAITICVAASMPVCASAQRALSNTDFEDNDPRGPGAPNYQIYSDADVPGWEDETGRIELWDSGFQGVVAYSGQVFAEMNANSPGTFYQDICMENGESFDWTFAHAARSGGPGHNPQVAVFEIIDPNTGSLIQLLASQDSFIGGGWSVNTGNAIYSGPSGLQRFQFRSTNPGSYGNFLDNIVVSLAAYIEMASDSARYEANSSGLGMVVTGTVDVSTSINFSVSGGTATSGVDFTVDASTITVPPGVYTDAYFALPITIIDDSEFETDETIEVTIGVPSSSELTIASGQCGPLPNTSAVHTITDNDPNLQITKSVASFDPSFSGGSDVFSVPGTDVIYTFDIENNGNGPIDADTLFLVDALPPELIFYNADIDGPSGPETSPVSFSQTGTGLTFDPALHVGFFSSVSMPLSFADCSYNPSSGYDDRVTHICIQPSGTLQPGSPGDRASFQFRARIK